MTRQQEGLRGSEAGEGDERQWWIVRFMSWRNICIEYDWLYTEQYSVGRHNNHIHMAWILRRDGHLIPFFLSL